MALVTAQNLARSFGAEDIFSGVTVSIPHGARIALVGPNGSGKTTLLRLLAKHDEPTEGRVMHASSLQIGLLPQEADLELSGVGVLWGEMLLPFADVLEQEARLRRLADELAERPSDEALIEKYGTTQARFEALGGYDYELRI